MRLLALAAALLMASACVGTTAKMAKLSVGMERSEVIAVMGPPDRVAAAGGVEYLIYHLASPKEVITDESRLPEYAIRLIAGRVDAYGRIDEVMPDR